MKIKGKEIEFAELIKSVLCIGIGTAIGLYAYWLCYVHHIAIFGFNLALIFAPIIAGLIETLLAQKLLGRNLGAISAIILFVDTTIHSFILRNPSLARLRAVLSCRSSPRLRISRWTARMSRSRV